LDCPLYPAGDNEKIKKAAAERLNIPLEGVACRGCGMKGGELVKLPPFFTLTADCHQSIF
jgi:hypothetical protein